MIERLTPTELTVQQAIGDLPDDGGSMIGDDKVHEILARLGGILHEQIADGGTFFRRGGGYDHRLAAPMDDAELAVWESAFDIDKVLEDAIDRRSLLVVEIDEEQTALPSHSGNKGLMRTPTPDRPRNFFSQEPRSGTVRVNYGDEAHWIPRDLLTVVEDTDDLTHVFKPEIHFGGYLSRPGRLYNAFVSLDTFVQAKNGTQLVSKIGGTGIPGSPTSEPVYSPHRLVATSLWMNTRVEEEKPNDLSVRIDKPERLMLGAALQNIDALSELDVPKSDKVRAWFWQLDRLISEQRFVLPSVSMLHRGEINT